MPLLPPEKDNVGDLAMRKFMSYLDFFPWTIKGQQSTIPLILNHPKIYRLVELFPHSLMPLYYAVARTGYCHLTHVTALQVRAILLLALTLSRVRARAQFYLRSRSASSASAAQSSKYVIFSVCDKTAHCISLANTKK